MEVLINCEDHNNVLYLTGKLFTSTVGLCISTLKSMWISSLESASSGLYRSWYFCIGFICQPRGGRLFM